MISTVLRDTNTTAPDGLAVSHEQLEALRNTFDERLGALERALLDPSQASALVPLVLDLTRVVTDEAAAAARQVCLETQLEAHRAALATGVADRQTITALRLSVGELQTQVDQLGADLGGERRQVAEARSAAEHGRGQLASLESRVAAAEERAEEAAATVRTLTEERTRLASSQAELQAEVAAARRDAEAAVATERAEGAALRQSVGEANAQLERSNAELDNERQALAAAQRAVKEGRARIATVEASAAEASKRTADEAAAAANALATASHTLAEEHAKLQAELAAARKDLEAAHEERAAATELRSRLEKQMAEAAAQQADARMLSDEPRAAELEPSTSAPPEAVPVPAGTAVADALRPWEAEDASEPPPAPATPEADSARQTYWDNTVRQDPRHSLSDGNVHIQVDGERAKLVDLSAGGAQVVTSRGLKPGHQVRVSLPSGSAQTAAKARVAWSRLEPGGSGLQYRAGLAFTEVDPKAIAFLLEGATPAPGTGAGSRRPEPVDPATS